MENGIRLAKIHWVMQLSWRLRKGPCQYKNMDKFAGRKNHFKNVWFWKAFCFLIQGIIL